MGSSALFPRLASLLAALLVLVGARAEPPPDHAGAHEHSAGDLVVFVSAEAHHFTSSSASGVLNEDSPLVGDFVLAASKGKFRLFGEFLLSNEEHDLERLQLGYEVAADTVLWLGRFHQPASAWNTEHHHGRYLQTAITRPSVELWEDEDGVLPQHITGLLLDSRQAVGDDAGLRVSLGAGVGTRLADEGLDPFDLLDPKSRSRRLSLTGRLAWLPDSLGSNQIGIVAARHRIPVSDDAVAVTLGANMLSQDVVGAFGDWSIGGWHFVGALYELRLGYEAPSTRRSESLAMGYLQVEKQLPHGLTAFARNENSAHAGRSAYIDLHPGFELRRTAGGLRWDFQTRQALTAEVGRGITPSGRQTEYRLQWSAAFP